MITSFAACFFPAFINLLFLLCEFKRRYLFQMILFILFCVIAVTLASPVQAIDTSNPIDFSPSDSIENVLFSDSNIGSDDMNPVDLIASEYHSPGSDSTDSLFNINAEGVSTGCNARKLHARDDSYEVTEALEFLCPLDSVQQGQDGDSRSRSRSGGTSGKKPESQLLAPHEPASLTLPKTESREGCRYRKFRLRLCCVGRQGSKVKDTVDNTWYFEKVEKCVESQFIFSFESIFVI